MKRLDAVNKNDPSCIKKKEEDTKTLNMVKKNVETAPPPLAPIPEGHIDAVINLSAESILWLKPVEGGLKIVTQDKFIRDVAGKIVDVFPYLMKFEDGVPTKIPHVVDDADIPPGFERRCDLKILADGQLLGLSLAPSSMKYYLSRI